MQPRCRQVPPTLSFSMRTTDLPSSAARSAAAYPPLPPPRMTRSDWLSATASPGLANRRRSDFVHLGTRPKLASKTGIAQRYVTRSIPMKWLSRSRKHRPGTLRAATSADLSHLSDFVRSRDGVEAFLEPRTAVTDTTVVLVAASGEWTRRRVDGIDGAKA